MDGSKVSGIDPELAALQAPARTRRTIAFASMLLTIIASIALLHAVRGDVGYFFAPRSPNDLGEVVALNPAVLESNSYVHVRGTPMASRMMYASRRFGTDELAVFPLAGQRAVFVAVPRSEIEDAHEGTSRDFSGRLIRFGDLGSNFGSVRAFMHDRFHDQVTGESYLLVAGEAPGASPGSLAIALLCIVFVAVNGFFLWRWFRPLPLSSANT